jgi:hypothetical protein
MHADSRSTISWIFLKNLYLIGLVRASWHAWCFKALIKAYNCFKKPVAYHQRFPTFMPEYMGTALITNVMRNVAWFRTWCHGLEWELLVWQKLRPERSSRVCKVEFFWYVLQVLCITANTSHKIAAWLSHFWAVGFIINDSGDYQDDNQLGHNQLGPLKPIQHQFNRLFDNMHLGSFWGWHGKDG